MILVEASLGWEWRRISDLDNQASRLEIQSVGSDFCHLVLAAKANRSLVVTYLLAAWEMDDLLSLACFHFISTTLLSVPHEFPWGKDTVNINLKQNYLQGFACECVRDTHWRMNLVTLLSAYPLKRVKQLGSQVLRYTNGRCICWRLFSVMDWLPYRVFMTVRHVCGSDSK